MLINEEYDKYKTKLAYWNMYINNLYCVEKNTSTDIMDMSTSQRLVGIQSCTHIMGKSLKNTLRKFNKDDLLNEILDIKKFYVYL